MKEIGNNGRLAAVLLIVIGYIFYYSFLFPELVRANKEYFWVQRDMSQDSAQGTCKIDLVVQISKNMIDYQDGQIIVNIISRDQSCKDAIVMAGNLLSEGGEELLEYPTFKILDENKAPTSYAHNMLLPYDLEQYDSISIPIHVYIPTRDASNVEFTFYRKDASQHLLPLAFGGEPTCPDDIKNKAKSHLPTRICASINSQKVLKQSALEHLLLPPWSNGILPLAIIVCVWLVENSMPQRLRGDHNDVDRFDFSKCCIIFLITLVFLLVLLKVGEIILFTDCSIWWMAALLTLLVCIVFVLSYKDAKPKVQKKPIQERLDSLEIELEQENDHIKQRLEHLKIELEQQNEYIEQRFDHIHSAIFDKLDNIVRLFIEKMPPEIARISEGKAKDAFECSNCGHRYSEAEIIERLNPCIQCGGKDTVKVVE